jgi:NAD(P)-dependent dehydrogenase (short-subunit alcohol dehydrogenase family)
MNRNEHFSVEGKRIVITGGTAGIGRGVAEHLASEGARVVITGRRPSGNLIAERLRGAFVQMDVTDAASVDCGMARAATLLDNAIDTVILNAGVDLEVGDIDVLDVDAFQRLYEVNVFGVVHGLKAALRYMGAGATVIVTSSPAATVHLPHTSAYSSSKAAINALTQLYALELAPRGIRINAVLPGIVDSEMQGSTGDAENIRVLTATGILRKPAELGPTYQFLASAASLPLTGAIVGADDGLSAGFSAELMTRVFGRSSKIENPQPQN